MSDDKKIEGANEAWENGDLGRSEDHVAPSAITQEMVDKAVDLKSISIRLPKSLIDEFKLIASLSGIGYQTLMRQILKRFADAEIKKIVRECILTKEEEAEKQRQLDALEKIEKKRA